MLYYDTDSVVFVRKPDDPEPPLGPYLGELTDELKGGHITTLILGGRKNLRYRTNTNKIGTKIRGITLDCTARQKIDMEVIHGLVHLYAACGIHDTVTVDIPHKIVRNPSDRVIKTKRMKKDYGIVYNKRVIVNDYRTLPYGF